MLRNFYIILCFSIYIDFSFCSEFISERGSGRSVLSYRNTKLKHSRLKTPLKRIRRNEGEDFNEFVAQVDLANFMQPDPEFSTADEQALYEDNKESYGSYESLNDFQLPDHTKEDNNLEIALGLYGSKMKKPDLETPNSSNSDKQRNSDFIHRMEKKRSEKLMRFPFFSREKTGAQKFKSAKKRKFFNFHPEAGDEIVTNGSKIKGNTLKIQNLQNRLKKRSNFDDICPLCKRKIASKKTKKMDSREKRLPFRIIHNDRQYYQEAAIFAKNNQKKSASNSIAARNSKIYKRDNEREDENRHRQIKELEEVQKKVDSVRISVPKSLSH